jgi:hypothetical protein
MDPTRNGKSGGGRPKMLKWVEIKSQKWNILEHFGTLAGGGMPMLL